MTSQRDCTAIDFKEGFIQKETNAVDDLRTEIQNLKEKINASNVESELNTLDCHMRKSYKHSKHTKADSNLAKIQNSVQKKMNKLENKYSAPMVEAAKNTDMKSDDILMKLANIEKKIETSKSDKELCLHTEALKLQVFNRLDELEKKIQADKIFPFQNEMGSSNDTLKVSNGETLNEETLKNQVFEKLAILENHMKLKSEVPVVNSDILRSEEKKLSQLLQMREKMIRGT